MNMVRKTGTLKKKGKDDMRTVIVGIAGGTASGKTTVVQKMSEFFPNEISVICHDYYYLAHDEMTYEERSHLNYDHPCAFETERLVEDIRRLKNGEAIDCPQYDFTVHNRAEGVLHIEPKPVIIVDGILVLEDERLRDLMDVKIFVDTDADERLKRRLIRDMKERGRSIESILSQYTNTVKPMHEQFVEPSKRYADIIIPRGGKNEAALEMLRNYMLHLISDGDKI